MLIGLFLPILGNMDSVSSRVKIGSELITENEIRKNHHKRSEKCVMSTNPDFFRIKKTIDVNFQKSISLIVRAHGEDISWIENNIAKNEEYGVDKVNPLFIACLLRLGDYLDFDSRRTPLCLFNYLKLKAIILFYSFKFLYISIF